MSIYSEAMSPLDVYSDTDEVEFNSGKLSQINEYL